MKKFFTNAWSIIKDINEKIQNNDPFSYSASIAYSTIFSLPAVLIIIIRITSYFYSDEAVSGELYDQLSGFVGEKSSLTIQEAIKNASQSDVGVIATVIGIVTLLISATTVFLSIQNALNNIWGVKPKPQKGLLKLAINRLLSFAIVASMGFIMLVSFVIDAILVAFQKYIAEIFSDITAVLMQVINYSISLAVTTLIFAMIFKVLPDAKIKWRDVWTGAFATTVLFTAGRFLIGLYLGNSSIGSTYGAAGSIVIVLVWVYYSSFIMLLGAIFTQVFSHQRGRLILPTQQAVFLVKRELDPDEVGIEVIDEIIRNKTDKEYI
ncbi:MAG TPA: YihY/virulence factor BrkB family protein [Cytophagales bacterium]|nr:YihY/virulence factor BrkB family protein [Cytophagales bacterium]